MTGILARLPALLRDSTTYSGIALLSLVVIAAHGAGVDLAGIADTTSGVIAQLATIAGALAAIVRALMPGTPAAAAATDAAAQIDAVDALARRVADLLREADAGARAAGQIPAGEPRA